MLAATKVPTMTNVRTAILIASFAFIFIVLLLDPGIFLILLGSTVASDFSNANRMPNSM